MLANPQAKVFDKIYPLYAKQNITLFYLTSEIHLTSNIIQNLLKLFLAFEDNVFIVSAFGDQFVSFVDQRLIVGVIRNQ